MKKLLVIVAALILFFAVPVMSQACWHPHCTHNTVNKAYGGAGGNATIEEGAVQNNNTNQNKNTNTNTNHNNNYNLNSNYNKNINQNYNENSNKNVNVLGQGQGQDQDQKQKQKQKQDQQQEQTQANKQKLELHQVYEDADNKREGTSAVGGAYGVVGPTNFERARMTGNVQSLADILEIRKTFTLGMLRSLAFKEKMHVMVKPYQTFREQLGYPKKGFKGMDLDKTIEIILVTRRGKIPSVDRYRDVAHITIRGENETTTISILAQAAIEAVRHGCDTLMVVGEGVQNVMEAKGWGVMFGGSIAGVTESTDKAGSAVIAPGVGYGESQSAYGFSPWIQAWGLKKK